MKRLWIAARIRRVTWCLMYGRLPLWQRVKSLLGFREPYRIVVSGYGQYIYALHDPFTMRPFYIGRSNNPGRRYVEHIDEPDNTVKGLYIQGLKRAGAIPLITIVEQCHDGNVRRQERFWIKHFGGKYWLANMTD